VATLQVNANTSQAVSAFNALAASINQTNASFARLNATMNAGRSAASGYSGYIGTLSSSFGRLQSLMSTTYDIAAKLGSGIQFVFNALLKEMDKLQGFNAIMSVTTKSADEVTQSYKHS
jgi:hypothetical protein